VSRSTIPNQPSHQTLFQKNIEALYLSPHISDDLLASFLERCLAEQDSLACVAPNLHQVRAAARLLSGSGIAVAAQIAYPLGLIPWEVKRIQIEEALQDGASQLDMLVAIETLKEGQIEQVHQEAQALAQLARPAGARITLVASLGYLDEAGQRAVIEIAGQVGAAVRTGSGIGLETSPQQVSQAFQMAQALHSMAVTPPEIVACGGVSLAESAIHLLRAGARRVCTGEPFRLLDGLRSLAYYGFTEAG
jgi:deoxyribose-phosphate aldolase